MLSAARRHVKADSSTLAGWRRNTYVTERAAGRSKGLRKNATTDLVISVPPGTVVKKKRSGQLLGELMVPGVHRCAAISDHAVDQNITDLCLQLSIPRFHWTGCMSCTRA